MTVRRRDIGARHRGARGARRVGRGLACLLGVAILAGPAHADASPASPAFQFAYEEAYLQYQQALKERDLESALIYARNAAQSAHDELGPRHLRTGILTYNLGVVELRLEHNRDASQSLRRAVEIYRAVHGKNSAELIDPYEKLGEAYEALGQWSAAERTYIALLKVTEHSRPDDHPAIARTLLKLMTVAEALEAHKRVRNYGLRTVRALEADPEDRSVEIGMAHLRLARNELAQGDGKMARKHMEAAAPLYEGHLEPDDPRLIPYYEFMAEAYDLIGRSSTARRYEKRLEESRARTASAQ